MTRYLGVWAGFALVHAWLAVLGVLIVPAEAFHDVELYRYWMALGLVRDQWPVLDGGWVYPAGAVLPMLLPALVTVGESYALAWCVMVTLLDGVAVAALLRAADGSARRTTGVWWWLGFLTLLGPVAVGRLDAVVAPILVLALLAGARHPRTAATLLTVGAWIKLAPGAVLLPLLTAVRRPLRDVIAPAAVVCAVVVAAVGALGGLRHLVSFVTAQQSRGLQVESVAATGWVLAARWREDVTVGLNEALVTWEVTGPGTAATARVLDVVLVLGVGAVAGLLWRTRQEGRAVEALVPGAAVMLTVLVVTNKVGSPQLLAWLAPPMAVALAVGLRAGRGRIGAGLLLVTAGLTQVVFPWGYDRLLTGDGLLITALVARNLALVGLLVLAVVELIRLVEPEGTPADDDAGALAGPPVQPA